MSKVTFYRGQQLPLEMHKVRIIQKLTLLPIEQRLEAITAAGHNTFLLQNADVFLDMLTDSGVNAMSQDQQAAMFTADDAYAGSATYTRLYNKLVEIFGMKWFLPTHQGRAAENILATVLVRPDTWVPMNYHFTTTKQHIVVHGGKVLELIRPEGPRGDQFTSIQGQLRRDRRCASRIASDGRSRSASSGWRRAPTRSVASRSRWPTSRRSRRFAASTRSRWCWTRPCWPTTCTSSRPASPGCAQRGIREITRSIADLCDVVYFSARKLGCVRGGGICIKSEELYRKMRGLVPLYEGFLTYGGMSVREIEALTVGLEETMDEYMINPGPQFIRYMLDDLAARGVPVVTPAGGLGCHVNARAFLEHVPQTEYPAGALASALYIAGGVRGMERGTLSEQRDANGNEKLADMELLRLAMPRRVFTLSQVKYAVDRLAWLYEHRRLVGGLVFTEEPEILRFFYGRLAPVTDWPAQLLARFREDFGDSL